MKHFYFFISWILLVSCQSKPLSEKVISVTIEPQRFFAEKIAGDKYKINTVVPVGQSPETYDPTPQQMVQIGQSTAYLQIGPIGFEQAWMKSIQENNPDLICFDLSEGVGFIANKEESIHPHPDGEECAHHHHHHHGELDPHIWSSVHGARQIAANTFKAFVALDKENAAFYQANYALLIDEIEKTGETIKQLLKPVLSRTFIIYHPALTYFAEENNLTQLCIEMDGKEPSPAQLKELVDTARNHNTQVVFVQEEFDQKNAELIAKETGCRIIRINPLAYDWQKEMMHIAKSLMDE
ncbi:zinc ABC transporter substrate-binding protein [Parabacteroides sp. 52]|uniref:metal ABC transporter solute-binding protein, Zn/Mn family n=1 Tax=unclassified Parabacteroides TaxID=2649774 RepID=UPI0013D83B89|nr:MULTISPECIES: zinc ABC transporter substrate-binding protein [unclassified Parabacteroides]MDH6535415.1 zinc transport system substrate-binding protein [Parabacteroides sp. PM5-20]NDV56059.1 zinc ABC transporter substrate-binding protein [Parabacteroides sp. 52]